MICKNTKINIALEITIKILMNTHLKLHSAQLKQLTQIQTHLLHDLNAYIYPLRNMKATIFHNNEHTNIIISKPDITLRNVEKTPNTFTLPSPHNTSLLEKTTKVLIPHPMTFIHQNKHYHVIHIQNEHSSEPTNHHSCEVTYTK